MHWKLAVIAVETGISPRELMALEPRMLWTIERYMISKAQAAQNSRRKRR